MAWGIERTYLYQSANVNGLSAVSLKYDEEERGRRFVHRQIGVLGGDAKVKVLRKMY